MLIALSLFLLSMFGGGQSFGKNLEKVFSDMQQRVEQTTQNQPAVKTMEATQREVKEFIKRFNVQAQEFSKLLSQHDAKREEFEQVYEQLEKYNGEAQDTVLRQREQLKSIVTREEWGKVFGE